MLRYWVMRTDRDVQAFIWEEIRAGRLRQGWGYQSDQDVRHIRTVARSERSKHQHRSWRGNRRMFADEHDSIQRGDVVVVPHVPRYRRWQIVRVTGPYYFEIDPSHEDYGHILPVELLTKERPVHPDEEAVPAGLRRTMRNQGRLWNIDRLADDVERVLAANEAEARIPVLDQRLGDMLDDLRAKHWERLKHHFGGAEFEKPCLRLLDAMYDDVEHTAGTQEQGADAICTLQDPLGVPQKLAVQIKMWGGPADDLRAVEQLQQAFEAYPDISGCVLLTTATSATDRFRLACRNLQTGVGIPVKVLLRDETLDLFIEHLPGLVGAGKRTE